MKSKRKYTPSTKPATPSQEAARAYGRCILMAASTILVRNKFITAAYHVNQAIDDIRLVAKIKYEEEKRKLKRGT